MAEAPNLRDVAIKAAAEALLDHEWVSEGGWRTTHRDHVFDASCAVCLGDLAQVVPVVLDAADAALAAVADGVTT